MRLSNKIVLASMNSDKWSEFQALFAAYPEIEIVSPEGLIRNLDKISFIEIHATYLENAVAKARLVNQAAHYPALADDTGLEVDALQGKPGIHSFRYATPPMGRAPFSRLEQDEANRKLLLAELAKLLGAPRTARFMTVLALNIEGILVHAQGVLEGTILDSPRGSYGFGYDSIFLPQGHQKTLAEMTAPEKNTISHRAKAVQKLMSEIRARGIVFVKP